MRIAVLSVLISFVVMVRAQQQVERYPQMCDELQQVFCDYVSAEAETRYMSSGYGQYVGQLIDNVIYGWGFFIANNNAQTFGQYRKGKHMFGITITDEIARVGSNEHYAEYDLKTGEIVRINTIEGNMRIPEIYVSTPEKKTKYGFHKITYSNGDVYCGETYDGKRHGYGIYYWANGDFWYGEYSNGYRQGYGVLFKPDHKLFYGKWVGDCKVK
ncbi:MAG: hypothetical protein IKD40_08755 [Bacteroidaceae bacterium]|nr:hypothetical protein [Bacteroidaceae bacterium]